MGCAGRRNLLLGLGRRWSRHSVLALEVVLAALGVEGALVGALAGEAFQFAGAASVRPRAFPGARAFFGGGAAAGEASERLVAVVHGHDHVTAVLPFPASAVVGFGYDVVLGLHARHFS